MREEKVVCLERDEKVDKKVGLLSGERKVNPWNPPNVGQFYRLSGRWNSLAVRGATALDPTRENPAIPSELEMHLAGRHFFAVRNARFLRTEKGIEWM